MRFISLFIVLFIFSYMIHAQETILVDNWKEYIEDYASPETRKAGEELIQKELKLFNDKKLEEDLEDKLSKIHDGERDFRY